MNNSNYKLNSTKGQQLKMTIMDSEPEPDILQGLTLEIIDLRKNWSDMLQTIHENQHIQRAMEKAYQDFQEGHKLKDFKYRNGINGVWAYSDIHNGKFPCILTTTNWLDEYEKKEWNKQSKKSEKEALNTIQSSIIKCKEISGNADILDNLEEIQNQLYSRYPPRSNQPESWRPHKSAYWTSKWMKILAETHFKKIKCKWKIVSGKNHSIVAGFTDTKSTYIIDIMLITTDINIILSELQKD